MWNKCDIIEPFHTKELVKHVFPCYYGNFIWFLSSEYRLIPSWCFLPWPTKEMRNVARKPWGSVDQGGMMVWSDWGITGVFLTTSRIAAITISREQTIWGYGIWTSVWNSCYSKFGPRSSSNTRTLPPPSPSENHISTSSYWFSHTELEMHRLDSRTYWKISSKHVQESCLHLYQITELAMRGEDGLWGRVIWED